MVKAKEFWSYLCEDLEYRFFSGVACPGLLPLYKGMSSEIMHYVPAANEKIALGLVSGAYLAGFKGCVLMDMRFITDIQRLLKFNLDYKIPLLIVGYGNNNSNLKIPKAKLNSLDDIKKMDKVYEGKLIPAMVSIEEGVIS